MGILVFDIETDGLDLKKISRIHTLWIYDYSQDEYKGYRGRTLEEGVRRLHEAETIVGHNIIDYDNPVIKKFFPWFSPKKVLDTLVWARLIFPDIFERDIIQANKGAFPRKFMGRHSLRAWGYRLGELKGDFDEKTDWKDWSPEMDEYCKQDVTVTKKLYEKLLSIPVDERALTLEHKVAEIIGRQTKFGFQFDVKKAEELYATLIKRREELHRELVEVFGSWYEPNGKVTVPKRDNKTRGIVKGCAYQNIKLVEFNPNSRAHIYKRLKDKYNWKPKEFTEKGTPKVSEEVLESLPYPEAKLLSEYLMVQKRISQLAEGDSAWLKMVKPDGRIYGSVITNGAVTGRMTHNSPNVAQVPAVKVPYGKECRELFRVPEGRALVGADASGLELRCLAHYMARYDGGAYVKELLEGDIHTANQIAAGLPTRDNAKTFIYAFLYGAGDEKIGSIIGGTRQDGKKLKNRFLKKIPAIAKLKEQVEHVAKTRKYLIGLDGRKLRVRAVHSALNTLLQSAGAILMKQALVILDEKLQQEGLRPGIDYEFVANIHDEWQIECDQKYAEFIGKSAVEAIAEAGVFFNFRCPLDGEYKIGKNWAETH